jgi:hypothetical protein
MRGEILNNAGLGGFEFQQRVPVLLFIPVLLQLVVQRLRFSALALKLLTIA